MGATKSGAITQGEWIIKRRELMADGSHACLIVNEKGRVLVKIKDESIIMEEDIANAKLIADAGNTFRQTAMLPSQLFDTCSKRGDMIVELERKKMEMEKAIKKASDMLLCIPRSVELNDLGNELKKIINK